MAAILKLTDEICLYRSTIGMGGMYWLVARELPNSEETFTRWLSDVSNRPAPFLDFDLRVLPLNCRIAFLEGAEAALRKLQNEYGDNPPENAYSYHTLKELVDTLEAIKVAVPNYPNVAFDGDEIDLTEIWEARE